MSNNNFDPDKTKGGYYPPWLQDQELGEQYKQKLVEVYNEYYNTKDKQEKKELLKNLQVYLTIVCDVIAYRYLMKHYYNLFYRLNITIEEYMEYKVERAFVTIRDKESKINDILSYIYMSFMLSSPRLIYDYAEKIGRCKLVKQDIPYFQTQRYKFFFIDRGKSVEHIIYNVDNIDLDSNSEEIHSKMDKYSLSSYNKKQMDALSDSIVDKLISKIEEFDYDISDNSRKYLLDLFTNWNDSEESKFEEVKQKLNIKSSFTIFDYIRYCYESKLTQLSYNDYVEVLSVLNNIVKAGKVG